MATARCISPPSSMTGRKPRNPLSAVYVRVLNSYISISSEKTRAGVITSFRSRLELWINPLVDAATSANDFDLRDIRKKRLSIYLGVTPDNLERLAPLMNLLFQQLIDVNTRELPNQNAALKYPCLLLMDEFTAIGKIGILSKGISYIAGYGLRMMPIIQSPSQLFEVYGREAAQTFTTNHALQIVFRPRHRRRIPQKTFPSGWATRPSRAFPNRKAKNYFPSGTRRKTFPTSAVRYCCHRKSPGWANTGNSSFWKTCRPSSPARSSTTKATISWTG